MTVLPFPTDAEILTLRRSTHRSVDDYLPIVRCPLCGALDISWSAITDNEREGGKRKGVTCEDGYECEECRSVCRRLPEVYEWTQRLVRHQIALALLERDAKESR